MSDAPLFLNVGSGQRPFAEPFVNVDCQTRWKPDVLADGANMPMFADETAQVIVLHQVLEHFGCGESAQLIRECHRILKPGGSLIVAVPDMKELAKGWIRGQITDQVYFTSCYGAYMGDEADRHKWGFTPIALALFLDDCLKNMGVEWKHVKTFDYRKIPGADIARDWWVLGIEAIK